MKLWIYLLRFKQFVFSNTLKDTGWDTAKLANRPLDEEVLELKQQSGKDIKNNNYEKIIGQAKVLKVASRIAPGFFHRLLNKLAAG